MRILKFLATVFSLYAINSQINLLAKKELLTIHLQSDINSTIKAQDQIRESFGKFSIESPELYDGNHQDFEHIEIVKDEE